GNSGRFAQETGHRSFVSAGSLAQRLQSVFFHLSEQSGTADTQQAGGLGAPSIGGGQRGGDGLLFALGEGDDGRFGGQGEVGHPGFSIRVRQGAGQAPQIAGRALI